MSDNFCSSCGKPLRHFDDHHGHHHGHHEHHHHHGHHHGHHHKRDEHFCEHFICDDHFKVRVGGLTRGLNFRLQQLIGCKVKMTVECGNECEDILAEVCFVGHNFVEVKQLEKLDRLDDPWESSDELIESCEPEDEGDVDDEKKGLRERKKEKEKEKKKRRKKQKTMFKIFPMDAVKGLEVKDDEHCDCEHDCNCCH
ncbi:hypothetical protein [Salirhabdus salicampi]|uniref:hypothetical protein n=1 Tax=Salirhabdus salicampi TaxID=476102 RepID=UPI0020C4AD80|nr:hypothetical protein [Salirhabdus salicampi]MCP8616009.1 hypothetical protein [Salirhabdus salicampi]